LQSSLLAPVLHMDRSMLIKPVEPTTQSMQTPRRSAPESSATLIAPPTEIPDSVERPPTQRDEMEIETPPPIKKKVVLLITILI
jgi:hypothetical protein